MHLVWSPDLQMGVIWDILKEFGQVSSFIHLLKIHVRNDAKIDFDKLINLVCMSPHCIALLS